MCNIWNSNASNTSGDIMNIYDFDNTIYNGDSSIDFFKYCLKINKKVLLVLPKYLIFTCLYLIKIIDKDKLKSVYFSFLKYFNNIDEVVNNFWESKTLKDFYLNNQKSTDIVVSASPEFLLKPVSKKYGFKLIATKVDKHTGKLLSKNCHDIEKVNRLKQYGITKCNNFYSDSLSDYPCTLLAKSSYIVKKDELIEWTKYKVPTIKKVINFFNRDFITFLAIGVINAFNGIWLALLYSLFIYSPIIAYILGFLTSLTIAYILNSLLNFKSKLSLKKYLKFCISNIPNFIIQITSVLVLIDIWNWSKLVSYSISAVIAVPITFILVKLKVFKGSAI